MARPTKQGIDYFPLDVNLDDKFTIIEAEHGLSGFAILIKLLQKIYSEGYFYEWKEMQQILFSKSISVDRNIVVSIVEDCLKWKIFDIGLYKKHKILTSKGIQTRYIQAIYKRVEVEIVKEYLLIDVSDKKNIVCISLSDDRNPDASIVSVNESSQSKVNKSKVNKSKVNKSKVNKSKVNKSNNLIENFTYSFDIFWNEYPRKESKAKAQQWFIKNKPSAQLFSKMMSSLERFKKTKQWQDKQYIPHPTTWLNQKRWEDEIEVLSPNNDLERRVNAVKEMMNHDS